MVADTEGGARRRGEGPNVGQRAGAIARVHVPTSRASVTIAAALTAVAIVAWAFPHRSTFFLVRDNTPNTSIVT